MLKHSKLASQILQEKEELRKAAKSLALHACAGHFSKVEAFWDSLLKRGGIVAPGVELTWASYQSGNESHLVFVGDEKSVIEALQGIKIERQPVPETVAVKMLSLRLMKIVEGISKWNENERKREEEALAQMAQVPKPPWATPYEILPELELSDLPDCMRYIRKNQTSLPANAWQYSGNGKAIFELRKVWRRPEVTQKVIEAAWKMVEVHKVMGS